MGAIKKVLGRGLVAFVPCLLGFASVWTLQIPAWLLGKQGRGKGDEETSDTLLVATVEMPLVSSPLFLGCVRFSRKNNLVAVTMRTYFSGNVASAHSD